jgi:hypothetical protein
LPSLIALYRAPIRHRGDTWGDREAETLAKGANVNWWSAHRLVTGALIDSENSTETRQVFMFRRNMTQYGKCLRTSLQEVRNIGLFDNYLTELVILAETLLDYFDKSMTTRPLT